MSRYEDEADYDRTHGLDLPPVGLLGDVRSNGHTPSGAVRVVTASSIRPRRIDWGWQPYMPAAMLTMVVGRGGAAKSTFMAHLIARLTRGVLPGCWFGRAAHALYIGAEDDAASVQIPRFIAAGADLDRVHLLAQPAAWSTREAADLADQTRDIPDLGIIVIDPMDSHLDGVDTHRKAETQAALASLVETLTDVHPRCAVAGLAHLNKGDSTDVVQRMIGSVAFSTSARAVLAVGEHPEDPTHRIIVGAKANMVAEDTAPAVRFKVEGTEIPDPDGGDPIETCRVVILGEEYGVDASSILTAPTAAEHEARSEAVEWLNDLLGSGPMKFADVEKAAREDGVARATLFRAKRAAGVRAVREESKRGRPSTWELA